MTDVALGTLKRSYRERGAVAGFVVRLFREKPLGAVGAVIVLAFLFSPLVFPRSVSAAEAAVGGKPIVYWRPGCQYCLRLRLVLIGAAGRASWVNIWADPDAAAAVRAVADGNETVPTVVVDGVGRVNPGPRWVRERLRAGPVADSPPADPARVR